MICAGYTTTVNADFLRFTPKPSAPRNWKDLSKIAAYEAEAAEKAASDACNKPLTGAFGEVVLLDSEGVQLKLDKTVLQSVPPMEETVFVLGAGLFLRLAVHEYLDKYKTALDAAFQWAIRSEITFYPYLWSAEDKPTKVVDPLHALLGSDDDVPLSVVVQRYGMNPDTLDNAENPASALDKARITQWLACLLGA